MTETKLVTENPTSSYAASMIRTLVPIIVGYVVTLLAKLKIDFHGDVTALVTAAVTAGYYVAARTVEHLASNPKWGWLLGKPSAPIYVTGTLTPITNPAQEG